MQYYSKAAPNIDAKSMLFPTPQGANGLANAYSVLLGGWEWWLFCQPGSLLKTPLFQRCLLRERWLVPSGDIILYLRAWAGRTRKN
jgi:hypothetical protein